MPLHHVTSFVLAKWGYAGPAYPLECRVRWNSCRSVVALRLGFLVDENRWNQEDGYCVPRSFHGKDRIPAATINAEIERYREAADKVFGQFEKDGIWPVSDDVRRALRVELEIDAPEQADTAQCFDRFFRECSVTRSWKEGTCKKMRTVGDHLKGYPPFTTMDGFTKKNLTGYVTHLRDEGMVDTTIHRQLGYLRWFLKWAEENRLLKVPDWRNFRPKMRQSSKPILFLTWDELMKLWNYETDWQLMQDVRDMFLFSCFTSLRWSDIQGLRWSDVTDATVSVVTVKTSDPITIDLNKWSTEILGRMVDRGFPDDRVFPKTENQVVNRYLKEIGKACGFDTPITVTTWKGSKRTDETKSKGEMLTFHAGRRTFICQALMMNIPPTTVMKWTGHSDFTAMKPYINVADAERKSEMSKFDRR